MYKMYSVGSENVIKEVTVNDIISIAAQTNEKISKEEIKQLNKFGYLETGFYIFTN